jgi:hypothetical protein
MTGRDSANGLSGSGGETGAASDQGLSFLASLPLK